MDTSLISHKREELKKAMNELCVSAGADQKLCDQIKDRGFWERLFANNTRDLARAGMSQMEIVEKLQQALQGLMAVVQDSDERERQLISVIDEWRKSEDEWGTGLHDAVGKAIRAVVKEDLKITRLGAEVAAGGGIDESKAAARKCAAMLSDYCEKATSVSGEEFCAVLNKTVQENFIKKGISLRNEDKQFLVREMSAAVKQDMEYDQGFGIESVAAQVLIERELEKLSPEGDKYTEFRDELVGIIDEFVTHKAEVDPQGKSIQQLSSVRRRLMESQFEIALIGEFQGGKSTTFNALCGGREISPRGLGTGGVKTSAAVITAQNIAGNETRNGMSEWAEITWLEKSKLQSRIAHALNLEDKGVLPSVAELENATKMAWKNLSTDDDDARDMLQVATLQLRLLNSKEFDAIAARNLVAIDEFQKYVQFPKNWEMRWGEKGYEADFTIEESLFAALDSVLVRIHSEYLQKLGCRITDCPGLFVSKWDTERALEVMSRSNAVWYLLNGDKEMGKEQKRVLQSIRQGGWHPKCFFTLNVKGDESSTDAILRANVAKIKNSGFNVENRVFKYNAAVAFRLAQLECITSGKFGKRDVDCLAVESVNRKNTYNDLVKKFSSDNGPERIKAIRQLIYNVLVRTGFSDPDHLTMTESELAADLEAFAGLKNIVRSLERHVISHGASSILLGDRGKLQSDGAIQYSGSGAELCKQVLEILRGDKKAEEEAAKRDFAEAQKKWKEDEDRFASFKRSVEKEFRFLDENKHLDDLFLADFYDWAWHDIHKDASDSAITITLEEWNSGHYTNTSVKEAATRRIKDEFSRIFLLKLNAYAKQITDTSIYKKEIGERIRRSWAELREVWEEMERENPHFEGLRPDEESVAVEINPFRRSIDQNIEIPSYFAEFFRNIGNVIASWFGAERETSEDRIRKYFAEKDPIKEALEALKDSYFKSIPFKELFAQARIQNKTKIDTSMANAEQKFEERIGKEKRDMEDSDSVRQQKAQEARRVREEIIEPRITRIADFSARVKAAYGN